MSEVPRLPPVSLARPFAHRGLHDMATGAVENSKAAFHAACDANYGIELDVQMSRDGEAMVFHDDDLGRMTAERGPVSQRMAADLGRITLNGGTGTIPTLQEILGIVNGRTPLLIELKDQDGALGPNVGPMERRVVEVLSGYDGPAACISWNPHAVAAVRAAAPDMPLGLVTGPLRGNFWARIPEARRAELRGMPDLARVGAAFITHDQNDLASDSVTAARKAGLDVFCWTIRSAAEEVAARRVADNITFEGYLPVS